MQKQKFKKLTKWAVSRAYVTFAPHPHKPGYWWVAVEDFGVFDAVVDDFGNLVRVPA